MNLIDYKSIFFIVVLSFMNAAIECTHCKKDIKGEYYYLDDSKYHEDSQNNKFDFVENVTAE